MASAGESAATASVVFTTGTLVVTALARGLGRILVEAPSLAILAGTLATVIMILASGAAGAAVCAILRLELARNAGLAPTRAAATAASVLLTTRAVVVTGLADVESHCILVLPIRTLLTRG
jgi:hypothetical protein